MGLQAEREILQKSSVNHDPKLNELVKRVGSKIAKAAHQPDYQWSFHVINSDQINAFCLPGGKIFVYTGLLKLIDNEAQLATVLGHEVAHAIARHGAERMSMIQLGEITRQVTATAIGAEYRGLVNAAYGIGANYGVYLPYSRKFEHEADEIGLYLMAMAGYDPREAIKFWQKMMEKSKNMQKPPEFASTHPADINRIRHIKSILPQVLEYYNKTLHKGKR